MNWLKKHGITIGGLIVGAAVGIGVCTITGYPRLGKLKQLPTAES